MAVKQWKHSKELIKDIKTKQDRYVTKYKKEICNSNPRDLIIIQDFYSLAIKYTWNFHEAGHGKGAPDGIGATCKRSADQLIAQRDDITNLYDFVAVLRERCPNINISVIEDVDIEKFNKMIKEHEKEQKPFKGTLLVHQVSGHIYKPNKLFLKSLSCFCDNDGCDHYRLGTITYQTNTQRLQVSDIFTDSEGLLVCKY
ncbi:unnamed protein product [Acanthoscelides obtectus]|uniref:Uncharacterized protein n=1 Tax=Acanthoscelides obtectus TaxID=200917 RepID=A0A9P0LRQ2_ACAOB|nr:unnamed protein product [Acanthoscelides obtectus]CAK1677542.1 hypothetical protein AOBTE_LOCUS31395 [Acanthoscelides obtectus]